MKIASCLLFSFSNLFVEPSLSLFRSAFLFAAQPTDQGEESVVVLLVVERRGPFSFSYVQFFLGVKRKKLCLKRRVKRQKPFLKRGV